MKTIKIIDIPKELPYIFRWKDNTYKRNGERYFRLGDNWEPTFYLFQLDEEVELFDLDEEDEFEDIERFGIHYSWDYIDYKNIEELKKYVNKDFQNIFDTLDKLIKNQKKIIEMLKKEGK